MPPHAPYFAPERTETDRCKRRHSPWSASLFKASDDRVRPGGVSVSYLDVGPSPSDASRTAATFHGHLNSTALGGSGFASQRTVDPFHADLTGTSGLVVEIIVPTSASSHGSSGGACNPSSSSCCSTDGKKGKTFSLTLKNDILPALPDGRDQSTVSWEYDFCVQPEEGDHIKTRRVEMPLSGFKATNRGREVKDAKLDLANIKRISFMMRRCVFCSKFPTSGVRWQLRGDFFASLSYCPTCFALRKF